VQQRCFEFTALLSQASLMQTVLPVDASCEDLEEDGSLSFLSDYVNHALANGAPPYSPPTNDEHESKEQVTENLKYAAYAAPEKPTTVATVPLTSVGSDNAAGGSGGFNGAPPLMAAKKANAIGGALGAAQGPWGQPKPAATPSPAPSPAATPTPTATAPVQSQAVASKPEPVDEGPRELTEKEREAALLFGGLSGSAADSTKRTSRRTSAKTPTKPTDTAPTAPQQAAVSQSVPVPAGPVFEDLLGFDMPVTSSTPTTQPALDVFGLSDLSVPTMPPAATPVDPFMMAGLGVEAKPTSFSGLSPLQMTTPTFGGKWTGLANAETRVTIPTSGKTITSHEKR
jgi:AP-4 complex subunit epsilon-1